MSGQSLLADGDQLPEALFAPDAITVEMDREGVRHSLIQRQLGHSSIATTEIYLASLSNQEVVDAIAKRPSPMVPAL